MSLIIAKSIKDRGDDMSDTDTAGLHDAGLVVLVRLDSSKTM